MRIGKQIVLLVCLFQAVAAVPAGANLILNGDFENNLTAVTRFNLSNVEFNALVPNATAFGPAEEIDLVTGLDFGIAPQSGDWKLGLHSQAIIYGNPWDAFSLDLSSPIVTGSAYQLSFYAAKHFDGSPCAFEIGLSSSATDFGTTLLSTSASSPSVCDLVTMQFLAPVDASFLTMRTTGDDTYTFVDNFSLDPGSPVPEPTSIALLGFGLAGVIALGLRRKRS